MEERIKYESELRDYLMDRVMAEIPYARINGSRRTAPEQRKLLNLQFIEGESMLIC